MIDFDFGKLRISPLKSEDEAFFSRMSKYNAFDVYQYLELFPSVALN